METRASEQEHSTPTTLARGPARVAAGGPVAHMLGLQRTIGNRRTAALVAGAPTRRLSRYKILGPFNMGQAVHETLTLLAIKKAKQALIDKGEAPGQLLSGFDMKSVPNTAFYDPMLADKSHMQFIRGVVWADDPEGLLFDNPRDTTDYSSGAMWYSHFKSGEKGDFSTMTARSHFGDLQFFHGMASSNAEAAGTTKQHMLNWARFLVNVANGSTLTFTKLKDVAEVSAHFPDQGEMTVKELFGNAGGGYVEIRQRAVGVLFHLIQDSYAHGHVERDATGKIAEFHAYGGQDEHKHGEHDLLGGSWWQSLDERLKQTKGALSAIDACATVMQMIAEGSSTDDVVAHLDKVVFRLAPGVRSAGAGTGLGKAVKPPPRPARDPLRPPMFDPGKI